MTDTPEAPISKDGEWPETISDGLTLPCSDCGQVVRFDYGVDDDFWRSHVPDLPERLSVVCLPCLDKRCGGKGLAEALIDVQWTGTGHTVVLKPSYRHVYADIPSPVPAPKPEMPDAPEKARAWGGVWCWLMCNLFHWGCWEAEPVHHSWAMRCVRCGREWMSYD